MGWPGGQVELVERLEDIIISCLPAEPGKAPEDSDLGRVPDLSLSAPALPRTPAGHPGSWSQRLVPKY